MGIWLPEYEIQRTQEEVLLRLRGGQTPQLVSPERWRNEERPRLWERFLGLSGEKEIRAFAKRFGCLGLELWNAFTGEPTKEKRKKVEETLCSLRAKKEDKATTKVIPRSELERVLLENPTWFQLSLWPLVPEPFSWWGAAQRGLAAFVALTRSLGWLWQERHGKGESRKRAASRGREAVETLTGYYMEFARCMPSVMVRLKEEEFEGFARSPVRERIQAASQVVNRFSRLVLADADLGMVPGKKEPWRFEAGPRSLFHLICLDYLFDLRGTGGGLLKPCANRDGRIPCSRFAEPGRKYCSEQCRWAVAQRRRRAKQAISCQESEA